CRDVRLSEELRRLLHLVLRVGNALNAGSARGNAKGITLDSLLKARPCFLTEPFYCGLMM
ncbi:hypothetical protein B8W95_13350, partial [Staphylococcus pasteuri]